MRDIIPNKTTQTNTALNALQQPLRFYFKVLADRVDADFSGCGFDNQHALAAELRHRFAPAFEHFLCCGGAEHFFLRDGSAFGECVELGMLQQHEDNQVLAN